jgi:hypothetical protein
VDRENLMQALGSTPFDEQTTLLFQVDSAAADVRRGHDCRGTGVDDGARALHARGFGVAVLEMENVAEVQKFGDEDPSIKAGMNTFEFCPMRIGAARGLA